MSELEMSPEAKRARSNRLQLIIILVIAATSLGGSYLLFFQARDGNLWGTTNQGQWVEPAINTADLALADEQGAAIAREPLWGVWVVAEGTCDDACAKAVHEMRQLHILLSKDADRVRRALIAPDAPAAPLGEPYPKLDRWRHVGGSALEPGIYIVDPMGNLVLRYALQSPGKPVLSDLKRLLKVSQIG